ncbi:unnamed protein product [Effrenium voratum]|uniref:Uncharacterized protein n=1 Tax=Effrenium voratum TaxID=2562239 RepID=A0AA36IG69_9DINO|nr:unnamed protein product [Effrenium voratum]
MLTPPTVRTFYDRSFLVMKGSCAAGVYEQHVRQILAPGDCLVARMARGLFNEQEVPSCAACANHPTAPLPQAECPEHGGDSLCLAQRIPASEKKLLSRTKRIRTRVSFRSLAHSPGISHRPAPHLEVLREADRCFYTALMRTCPCGCPLLPGSPRPDGDVVDLGPSEP